MAQGVWSPQLYADPPSQPDLTPGSEMRLPFAWQAKTGWLTAALPGQEHEGLQQSQKLHAVSNQTVAAHQEY